MKKNMFAVAVFAAGILVGCAMRPGNPNVVNASPAPATAPQPTPTPTPVLFASPHVICGGNHDCAQYVLEVSTQRGFGPVFVLYSVPDQAHVVDTSQLQNVAGGFPSFTFQAVEPAPREDQTFTVTVGEP